MSGGITLFPNAFMAWCLLKHTDNFTLLYFTYNTDICSKPVDKLQN